MSINPTLRGCLSTIFALAVTLTLTGPAWSQVQPAQILAIRAKIDDGPFTTPKADDLPKLTVSVIKVPGGGSGYQLTDNSTPPNIIRKFYDADGDNRVDTWCFYKDGQEVYREQMVKNVYTFRWVGAGGTKWGVGTLDGAQKAKIEQWKMITAEEAAQEAFAALTTGDFDRMKALFITPQEMQALGLPAAEQAALTKLQQTAAQRFQAIRLKVKGLPQAKFDRLEGGQPGCFLAENIGGAQDIFKARGILLFQNPAAANPMKQTDYLNSGDIIQVGNAWRLTDIPSDAGPIDGPNAEYQAALNKLPKVESEPRTDVASWTAKVVAALDEVVKHAPATEQENWSKQIVDRLSSAYSETEDPAVLNELGKRRAAYVTKGAESLASYAVYREIAGVHQAKIKKADTAKKIQDAMDVHMKNLEKFVADYPSSEDASNARIDLAMNSELDNKDAKAKDYYQQIVDKTPNTPNGLKAAGAVRRIDSVGKAFDLTGTTITGTPFAMKGRLPKITLVYYWASYSKEVVIGDFARMKKLQEDYPKDLDIVCVNLDEKERAAEVAQVIGKSHAGVTHLHQPVGGLNGPLAIQYGVFAMPHIFVIDREGNVANNRANIGTLDEELQKLTKAKN